MKHLHPNKMTENVTFIRTDFIYGKKYINFLTDMLHQMFNAQFKDGQLVSFSCAS